MLLCHAANELKFQCDLATQCAKGCCVRAITAVVTLSLCVLQPPFNEAARAAAGFGPEWYLPLASEVLK